MRKRRTIIIVVVGLLLGGSFFGYLYRWRKVELRRTREDVEKIEAEIQGIYRATAKIDRFAEEEKRLNEELTYLRAKLVSREEIPRILKLLTEEGEQFEIKFISLTPQLGRLSLVTTKAELTYEELPIRVDMECRYQNLGRYLERLRELPILITISRLGIRREKESLPDLKVQLMATTYLKVSALK